ncbi:alpha/beta fold hydrolase [Planctomicrobium piriforme]|uniref:Alpha/beta hydrolase family protein n=1 Tax=Planctomicrobium piriforme TaxID=1576369 RepID=A0A1I3TIL5_9PLAN|nr:alpha/beta fold hydrolase [Planctomicrobium piriforme]SFJ70735.1 Alpha/beta hydrolase of unknown function [Planctomicrobium piriforme]
MSAENSEHTPEAPPTPRTLRSYLVLLAGILSTIVLICSIGFALAQATLPGIPSTIAPQLGTVPDYVLQTAANLGISIFQSRWCISAWGYRMFFRKSWKLFPESTAPVSLRRPESKSAILVFVHGFNTTMASAVGIANDFSAHLEHAIESPNDFQKIWIVSYCWRGDLGPSAFCAAERAAEKTAPIVADFLAQLRAQNPDVPIVVMTHSLGARVGLQALTDLAKREMRPWIDGLLLVQPAVMWGSIRKGIYNVPRDGGVTNWTPGAGNHEVDGRYVPALTAANRVFVTKSSKDNVLSFFFSSLYRCNWVVTVPDMSPALGMPIKDIGNLQVPSEQYFELDLSLDQSPPPESPILEHTPIGGESDKVNHEQHFQVVRYLWQQVLQKLLLEKRANAAELAPAGEVTREKTEQ